MSSAIERSKPRRVTTGDPDFSALVEQTIAKRSQHIFSGASAFLAFQALYDNVAYGLETIGLAMELEHEQLLAKLLELKEQPDPDEAAALGRTERLTALLDSRWKLNRRVRGHGEPERPLHLAAWHGRFEAAELLLERGYSPGAPNNAFIDGSFVGPEATHNRAAFHIAAMRGRLRLVELFVSKMRDMREPGKSALVAKE